MPAPTATSPSGTAPPSRSSEPWRTGTWRCGWRGASSAAAMPSPGSARARAGAGCWSRWTTRRPTPGASRSRPNRSRSFRDGPSSRSPPRPRPARLGGDEGPAAGASRAGPRARARRRAAVVGRSDAGDPHRAAVLGPGLGVRGEVRRRALPGLPRRLAGAAAVPQPQAARRPLPGVGGGAGGTGGRRLRGRRGDRGVPGGPQQLRPAAAAHAAPRPRPGPPQRGGGLPVPVRRAARGRLRPDWPGAAAAQGRAAAPAGVSRPPPVHPPSQRRRRGLLAAGLPEGLGGGVIAKRADAPYAPGRSGDWLKFKCVNQQELVIGGYTDPKGSRHGLGALLLGYYRGDELVFAGKVGTGFDQELLGRLRRRLGPLEQNRPPFSVGRLPRAGVHWVRPELVAQIGFSEWTSDGQLRHPRFLGLRDDKRPREVVRERPQ